MSLDTDGTLLNSATLPPAIMPTSSSTVVLGPGSTLHSAVDNNLFNPDECVYVTTLPTSNQAAICGHQLTFRRVMINQHEPTVSVWGRWRVLRAG